MYEVLLGGSETDKYIYYHACQKCDEKPDILKYKTLSSQDVEHNIIIREIEEKNIFNKKRMFYKNMEIYSDYELLNINIFDNNVNCNTVFLDGHYGNNVFYSYEDLDNDLKNMLYSCKDLFNEYVGVISSVCLSSAKKNILLPFCHNDETSFNITYPVLCPIIESYSLKMSTVVTFIEKQKIQNKEIKIRFVEQTDFIDYI